MVDVDDPAEEDDSARRAADYVRAVLGAVDDLPVVFAQRRSESFLGRLTMPGNRQLVHLFVRRQLTVTLRRLKSETGLAEMAEEGRSESAGRLDLLADAAGAKTGTVIPIAIVLGTIGVMVSLLSIVQPNLQQEADLLGSLPKVITLDGAAVADTATAFDDNPSVFSPADLEGVFNALGLAAIVVFGLFSVLAGSAHAAAAILDDPWRYDPSTPFRESIRRGPVPTQRGAFGVAPRRIHTPVAADLVRNAALYLIVLLVAVLGPVRDYAAAKTGFFEYWRVGGSELLWTAVLLVFPASLLVGYLVIRHRRASDGRAVAPPARWRVLVGTVVAFLAGLSVVGAATWATQVRMTPGADLAVYRAGDDSYFVVEDLEAVRSITDLKVQSVSYYPVDVSSSEGSVTALLLVTELATATDFLSADVDDEALRQLRTSGDKPSDDSVAEAWISEGLASRLDPATGDRVDAQLTDDMSLEARATTVFLTPGTEDAVIVLDVEDFPPSADLLIDEIYLRGTDGPLRDDSTTMKDLDALLEVCDDCELLDFRREFAFDRDTGIGYMVMAIPLALGAVLIAFGRPRRWRTDTAPPAPGATPPGSALQPPAAPAFAPPTVMTADHTASSSS